MRLTAAFFRMIRLPNLLFIALTQCLLQYSIYHLLYYNSVPSDDNFRFILLSVASILIAAGGYAINDYFDINIDEVNKPQRMVVDKVIHRRWAIAWHFMLSTCGVILTALALPVFQKWYLLLANILCVALLWFYSTTFKRRLLIGNFVIALLTAWTVLIIFFSKHSIQDAFAANHSGQAKFFRFAFLYAGFAFIISLIREAIKDVEDRDGDARYGCRTMPIVWGVNVTKVYTAIWLLILLGVLIIIQVYVLQFGWWWAVVYCLLAIVAPVILILRNLLSASSTADYRRLSAYTKMAMFTGILSMIFFYIYL